jgi:hypothetical protein
LGQAQFTVDVHACNLRDTRDLSDGCVATGPR